MALHYGPVPSVFDSPRPAYCVLVLFITIDYNEEGKRSECNFSLILLSSSGKSLIKVLFDEEGNTCVRGKVRRYTGDGEERKVRTGVS